jgi:hypothetical protein
MKPNSRPKLGVGAARVQQRLRALVAHAHHEEPVGAEANRRTQRRDLTHGAVAEVLTMHSDRGKQEWHRAAGH